MMTAFGARLWVHVCFYSRNPAHVRVCVRFPVAAASLRWQAENTFIFPTLIVKAEVEETDVCVSVETE